MSRMEQTRVAQQAFRGKSDGNKFFHTRFSLCGIDLLPLVLRRKNNRFPDTSPIGRYSSKGKLLPGTLYAWTGMDVSSFQSRRLECYHWCGFCPCHARSLETKFVVLPIQKTNRLPVKIPLSLSKVPNMSITYKTQVHNSKMNRTTH